MEPSVYTVHEWCKRPPAGNTIHRKEAAAAGGGTE